MERNGLEYCTVSALHTEFFTWGDHTRKSFLEIRTASVSVFANSQHLLAELKTEIEDLKVRLGVLRKSIVKNIALS